MPQIEGEDLSCGITLKGFLVQTSIRGCACLDYSIRAAFSIRGCVLDVFRNFLTLSMVGEGSCMCSNLATICTTFIFNRGLERTRKF